MNCSRKENSNLRVTRTREECEVPLTLVRNTAECGPGNSWARGLRVSPLTSVSGPEWRHFTHHETSGASAAPRLPPRCSEWPSDSAAPLLPTVRLPGVLDPQALAFYSLLLSPESPAVRHHLQQDHSPQELTVSFTWKGQCSQEGVIPGWEGGQSCHDYAAGASKGWAVYSPKLNSQLKGRRSRAQHWAPFWFLWREATWASRTAVSPEHSEQVTGSTANVLPMGSPAEGSGSTH